MEKWDTRNKCLFTNSDDVYNYSKLSFFHHAFDVWLFSIPTNYAQKLAVAAGDKNIEYAIAWTPT